MDDLSWADRYLLIPFKERGRDDRGADCFGLVALVLAREARLQLSELGCAFSDGAGAIVGRVEAAIATGRFVPVKVPQRFDLVQLSSHWHGARNDRLHVGIATSSATILHSEQPHGPKHERLDSPLLKRRVVGFWRLKEFIA